MDAKKLLVISDTHGHTPALKAVLVWAAGRLPPKDTICAAAFLGDGISDLRKAADAAGFYSEWKIVNGNNDYGYSTPESALFEFAGVSFYLCHGHRHHLYSNYQSLVNAANASDANAVLFGHTHVPYYKIVNGIHLVNPGSVGRPRSRIGATFALVECCEGVVSKVEFWGIGARGEIARVKV